MVPPKESYETRFDIDRDSMLACTITASGGNNDIDVRILDADRRLILYEPRLAGTNTIRVSVPRGEQYWLILDNSFSSRTHKSVRVRCVASPTDRPAQSGPGTPSSQGEHDGGGETRSLIPTPTPTRFPSPPPTPTLPPTPTPTPTPTPAPTPTPTPAPPPRLIPGLTAADVTVNLENAGFTCDMWIGASGNPNWDCKMRSSDWNIEASVTIMGFSPSEIFLVDATVLSYGPLPITEAAKPILGYIATLPYQGAQPEQARAWVEENIDNVGEPGQILDLVIGDVRFELYGSGREGVGSRVLELKPAAGLPVE